jgi:hypothetical protein
MITPSAKHGKDCNVKFGAETKGKRFCTNTKVTILKSHTGIIQKFIHYYFKLVCSSEVYFGAVANSLLAQWH